MSIVPAQITAGEDAFALVKALTEGLESHNQANFEANAYYEASKKLGTPGFAVPAEVAGRIAPVTGAPGIVVDVLEERLDFTGWDDSGATSYGLDAIYDENELDSEASLAHLDALIFGTSFVRVGQSESSDTPLITVHSPMTTTGMRNPHTRRLDAAWTTLLVKDGRSERGVLDLVDASVTLRRSGSAWVIEDVDDHGMGRVPVVQFANRARASRPGGRSEITRGIRSLTEDMMRAGLGMNVNSMFYSIPQLMLLGRGPDAFKDRNGNPVAGWKILAGHALAIAKDEDGDAPDVKQLTTASPTPFIDQLREFRMQIAAEAGMPADYLGIQTSNPSSADAIRAGEARLVKRAERRQATFGRSWMEVARLALLVRDGEIPADFNSRVTAEWQSAATPTRAATADEVTKLVGANILAPDSVVTRKRLDLSRSEERALEAEARRNAGRSLVESLIAAPAPPAQDVTPQVAADAAGRG